VKLRKGFQIVWDDKDHGEPSMQDLNNYSTLIWGSIGIARIAGAWHPQVPDGILKTNYDSN
jgi:hypothetical protein